MRALPRTQCDEVVAGALLAAQEGPVPGWERLSSEGQWREACETFSPWVRRCIVLSKAREELASCTPGNEPWSRAHEFGGVPEAEKEAFLGCVEQAQDRAGLEKCDYAPAAAAPARADCVGEDRRLYGTTCCTVQGGAAEERTPGEVILDCEGPQVGKACTREGDCDIACSCDSMEEPLRPGDGQRGPADGTVGVKGVCAGQTQRGVWSCRLDERGAVTHLIID